MDRAVLDLFRTLDVSRGIPAIMGDGAGTVKHPRIPLSVWVRLVDPGTGNVHLAVAYNTTVANKNNLWVFVRPTRRRGRRPYEVVATARMEVYPTRTHYYDVGPHGEEHTWPTGSDIISLDTRQLLGLRAREQATPDMTLIVDPGYYDRQGVKHFAGGNSPTFTKPAVLSRWDLLVLNALDALAIIQGSEAPYASATLPLVPTSVVPICAVLLYASMAAITETCLRDLRHLPGTSSYVAPPSGSHAHADKEDKSAECDGAKTVFYTANEFEEGTLRVVLNGHDLPWVTQLYTVGAMFDSFTMALAPSGDDTLLAYYIARLGG